MDNQHKLIKGYRDLSQDEIDAMNAVKGVGAQLDTFISRLEASHSFDQRWVAIGRTDLQKGIMALVRAIARPESF